MAKYFTPRSGYSRGRIGNPTPPLSGGIDHGFSQLTDAQLKRLDAFFDEHLEMVMAGDLPPAPAYDLPEGSEDFSARALENLTTGQLEMFLGALAARTDLEPDWTQQVKAAAEGIVAKKIEAAQRARSTKTSAADTGALAEAIRGMRASGAVEKKIVRGPDGRMTHTIERKEDGSLIVEELVRDADNKRMLGVRAVTYTAEGELAARARGTA